MQLSILFCFHIVCLMKWICDYLCVLCFLSQPVKRRRRPGAVQVSSLPRPLASLGWACKRRSKSLTSPHSPLRRSRRYKHTLCLLFFFFLTEEVLVTGLQWHYAFFHVYRIFRPLTYMCYRTMPHNVLLSLHGWRHWFLLLPKIHKLWNSLVPTIGETPSILIIASEGFSQLKIYILTWNTHPLWI